MDSVHKKIKEISLNNPNKEVCGFVVSNNGVRSIVEAANQAVDESKFFEISTKLYLKTVLENEKVEAVYHSHIEGDAEPSEFDMIMIRHICLDFLIYSVEFDEFKLTKAE